jgi:hypothetical protein
LPCFFVSYAAAEARAEGRQIGIYGENMKDFYSAKEDGFQASSCRKDCFEQEFSFLKECQKSYFIKKLITRD